MFFYCCLTREVLSERAKNLQDIDLGCAAWHVRELLWLLSRQCYEQLHGRLTVQLRVQLWELLLLRKELLQLREEHLKLLSLQQLRLLSLKNCLLRLLLLGLRLLRLQ